MTTSITPIDPSETRSHGRSSKGIRRSWPMRIAIFSLVALPTGWSSITLPPTIRAEDTVRNGLAVTYERNNDCLECHSRLSRKHDFVQQDAGPIWEHQDKHPRAFSELQRHEALVTRILGFPMNEVLNNGRVSQRAEDRERVAALRACLSCHATWPVDEPEPPVELSSGVSCQACHGPGLSWSRPHREPWWRLCTPEAKSRLGFTNVRDPLERTQLCVSCHVGDFRQGRFVTHAMYAAGHPPLPGFEYGAFQAQMPAHWRSLKDKGSFAGRDHLPAGFDRGEGFRENFGIRASDMRSSYREANFPNWKHDPWLDMPRTKEVAIASVAALRGYARWMRDTIDATTDGSLPADFALFDCSACHHELGPSLVTTRALRSGARPGRPSLAAWPVAVAQSALAATETDPSQAAERRRELQDRWARVQSAATRRPFGDRSAWIAAADEFDAWAQAQTEPLVRRAYGRDYTLRFAQALTNSPPESLEDFHSARQIAWALREITIDLGWNARQRDQLFRTEAGNQPLLLELPHGQDRRVLDHVPTFLDAADGYHVDWMREQLAHLRETLDGSQRP